MSAVTICISPQSHWLSALAVAMSTSCVWYVEQAFEVKSRGSSEAPEEWSLFTTARTSLATQSWNGFIFLLHFPESSFPPVWLKILQELFILGYVGVNSNCQLYTVTEKGVSARDWPDHIFSRVHLWDNVLIINWSRKAQATVSHTIRCAGGPEMIYKKPTVCEPAWEPEGSVWACVGARG